MDLGEIAKTDALHPKWKMTSKNKEPTKKKTKTEHSNSPMSSFSNKLKF